MSFDPTFLNQIFSDDQVDETLVDWSESVGFTTLYSIYGYGFFV